MGASAFPILRPVQHGCNDYPLRYPNDLINHDLGQSWHDPFERIGLASGMPHEREGDQQLRAAEKSPNYVFSGRRAILRDPAIDVFEIDNRLVVEDKLHRAL